MGNCFYKEIEEGLKYVYSEAFNAYEIEDFFCDNKLEKIKIPKAPISTQEFHIEILNNIAECCNKETQIKINTLIDIY